MLEDPATSPASGGDDDAAPALQRQIDDLRAQLAHARQGLDEFNYAVAHDLRAPLRHVRAYLQIVQEDFGEGMAPALQKHLHTVDEAAAQMARMVDALLVLSRLRQADVQRVPLDLHALLQQARDEVEADGAQAAPRTAPLLWHVAGADSDAGSSPQVLGDPELVLQVLRCVLSNAAKFTARQPAPRVDVAWRVASAADLALYAAPGGSTGPACAIEVRDNGAGFDPRQADGLFKPFQRLHAQRDFAGLGTGLAYARLALQRMGGGIHATSTGPDSGCAVVMALPLAGVSHPPVESAH